MYNLYEIDNSINYLYGLGDLHGSFQLLKYKIRELNLRNSLIVIAGDIGFGFEKPQYYLDEYNKMKSILLNQNVYVIFVRGNHDNKEFFDGKMINFPHFHAVPDYSVIRFTNENGVLKNILCVGGAISIDRVYRKNSENRTGKKSYWVDEIPVFSPEILMKIKNDDINIDVVITHTSPSFAPLTDKNGIAHFMIYDTSLNEDISNERLVLTKLYDQLVKIDKHPIKVWIYGHFHKHTLSYSEEDVKFVMLDCFSENNNSWDLYPVYFD